VSDLHRQSDQMKDNAELRQEIERLRATWSIAMKALSDIDTGREDARSLATDALRRIEVGGH